MARLIESSVSPLSAKGKTLSGVFATLGTKNKNGRIYPRDIYESAYKELVPKLQSNSLLGECDHPLSYDEVRLSNVSHVITECQIGSDGRVTGTVELLDTPAGKVVQSLVEAGVPIGISSRGIGDVRRTGDAETVTNFKLITFDLVAEPSFSEAVLSESAKSKLGESLTLLESHIPLRESANSETDVTKGLISRIRESLLVKTDSQEVNIKDIELTAVKTLAESKSYLLNKRITEARRLNSSLKRSLREVSALKRDVHLKESLLENLNSNMHELQEAYNVLSETTVSRDEFSKVQTELVEALKHLEVEKRGMSYSQVGHILEGLSTRGEISAKLDTLTVRRRHTELPSTPESLRENFSPSGMSRLSKVVSQV